MADRLFLSYRLRDIEAAMPERQFEQVIRAFPFSKLSTGGITVRVHAVSETEPAIFEQVYAGEDAVDAVAQTVSEYSATDTACIVEAHWDLWQYDKEWKLSPTRVALLCFGPSFDNEAEDQIRIDFGPDSTFLPQHGLPNFMFMAQSNIRSLLHLTEELDKLLTAAVRRRLWTESGDNFAARVAGVLEADRPGPRMVS